MTRYPASMPEAFTAPETQFRTMIAHLSSPTGLALEHNAAETYLDVQGRELLRGLLQGYLDTRAAAEIERPAVTGADGVVRPHHRASARALESVFGPVRVTHLAYSARGAPQR